MKPPLRRAVPRVALACTTVALLLAAPVCHGVQHTGRLGPAAPEGRVQLVQRTGPSFDRFTDRPSASTKRWMSETLHRNVVFSPYFDARVGWLDNGWVYKDAYGLGARAVREHPRWVLRSAQGRRLYIPYGCARGRCIRWAGDPTLPAFRRAWIADARATLAKGYRGVWIDDVNLEVRVGDGQGNAVRPVDRRTGRPMTDSAWRDAMATFMEEVRSELGPAAEIVHNSIWYAGGARREQDPSVRREIAAADWINLERGVNDAGLTGGTGDFSLNRLLGFVDAVHAAGRSVVLEGMASDPAGREANLAAFLLVSQGHDGVAFGGLTPTSTWAGAQVDLGRARGPRRLVDGVLRRDFAHGTALLAPPGSPRRTVDVGPGLVDTTGHVRERVTLTGGRGAVLRTAGSVLP